jgi:beta-N-acetylhexosaminidase
VRGQAFSPDTARSASTHIWRYPTYASTREELEEVHLAPFRTAIGAGVGGIMIGHIALPEIDASGTPASLSYPVVTGILREQLGFRGLVFTDDLEMKALPQDDIGNVAVQAVAAGCDMLLMCHSPEKARAARDAILDAVNSGSLDPARVRDSLQRVQWAKRKFGVLT